MQITNVDLTLLLPVPKKLASKPVDFFVIFRLFLDLTFRF